MFTLSRVRPEGVESLHASASSTKASWRGLGALIVDETVLRNLIGLPGASDSDEGER